MVQESNLPDPKVSMRWHGVALPLAQPSVLCPILGALGVAQTPDAPFKRRPLSSAELGGHVARHRILRTGRAEKSSRERHSQSLYGSNSPDPAIATANGRSVCRTLMVPSCLRSTAGSRR